VEAPLSTSRSPIAPPFFLNFNNLVMLNGMSKGLMYLCITIGSIVGSYIPVLWHAGFFSLSGIAFGLIGAFVGIWVAFKLNNYLG
jgi:uncharacterized membrane protein YeaQ/YmgE (transglycosylase-associated protein family)